MATYSATFSLDGTDFPVLSCNYSFGQGINDQGQPSTDVKGGPISLQIAASDDNSIIGWMIDPTAKKNGSITFLKSDGGGNLKEVKFEDGICVGYSESFNSSNSLPMTISLNITAKKISVGDASHEKKWNDN
jgi:hypothetical protein